MRTVKLRNSKFYIHEVTTVEQCGLLAELLSFADVVAVDTETEEVIDGWHPIGKAKCFSIQFGIEDQTWFVPTWGKYSVFLEILKPYLENTRRTKILHNAIFDMHVLANHGIFMQGLLCDTLAAEYTWYNDSWYPETGDRFPAHMRKVDRKLKGLCSMYFDEDLPDYKETFSGFTGKKKGSASRNTKGKKILRNSFVQNLIDYVRTIGGHDEIVEYASKDPYLTFMLYKHVRARLEKDPWLAKSRKGQSMWDYFQEIEVPFTESLFSMEREGIPLDWEALGKLDEAFESDAKRLRAEWKDLCEKAGGKRIYNIGSPQDVAEALVNLFGERLDKRGKAKADGTEGAFSVAKEVLEKLGTPAAKVVLEWRTVDKAKGTYTETLREAYTRYNGKIHTNLNQTGTRTGRISSRNPNLLNQPSRTESGRAIRACFCALNEDEEIGCIDWDSAELKETYHFSKEEMIGMVLKQGLKQHAVTAGDIDPEARAWRNGRTDKDTYKELEKKFPVAYFKGKTFNFGVVYGMGVKKFAKMAGISEREAKEAFNAYWKARPNLKRFRENAAAAAEAFGYVLDILKIPIWIAEVGSADPERKARAARKAGNSIIQGSIAKRAKMVMILLTHDKVLKDAGIKLLLNIYDEFLFRAPKGMLAKHKTYIEERVRNPLKYFGVDAPDWYIDGSLGISNNWRDAKAALASTMKIKCFYNHEFNTREVVLVHDKYSDDKGGQVYTKSLFWMCSRCDARNTVSTEHRDYEALNKLSVYK